MNSLSSIDGNKVYILMTCSQSGGLPLGIIITSSEDEHCLTKGFEMLQDMLDSTTFHYSPKGPNIFITDDNIIQHTTIETKWTNSKCLLCPFHVLQSLWKWLVNAKNGIVRENRKDFFKKFKSLMYTTTVDNFEDEYVKLRLYFEGHSKLLDVLEDYYVSKELWAVCFRTSFAIRNHETNSENKMKGHIIKEKLLGHLRSYSILQLIDFFLTRYVDYYTRILLDSAHNIPHRFELFKRKKMRPSQEVISKIKKLDDIMFRLPSESSENQFYYVNIDALICSCLKGNAENICRHIEWVHMLFYAKTEEDNIDLDLRCKFYKIATGREPPFLAIDNSKCNFDHTYTYVLPKEESSIFVEDVADEEMVEEWIDEDWVEEEWIDEKMIAEEVNTKEEINEGERCIEKLAGILKTSLHRAPSKMSYALKVLVDQAEKCGTVGSLASACVNFGKGKNSFDLLLTNFYLGRC